MALIGLHTAMHPSDGELGSPCHEKVAKSGQDQTAIQFCLKGGGETRIPLPRGIFVGVAVARACRFHLHAGETSPRRK